MGYVWHFRKLAPTLAWLALLGSFCPTSAWAGADPISDAMLAELVKAMSGPDAGKYDFEPILLEAEDLGSWSTKSRNRPSSYIIREDILDATSDLQEKGQAYAEKMYESVKPELEEFYKKHRLPDAKQEYERWLLSRKKIADTPLTENEAELIAKGQLEQNNRTGKPLDFSAPFEKTALEDAKNELLLSHTKRAITAGSMVRTEEYEEFLKRYTRKQDAYFNEVVKDIFRDAYNKGWAEFVDDTSGKAISFSELEQLAQEQGITIYRKHVNKKKVTYRVGDLHPKPLQNPFYSNHMALDAVLDLDLKTNLAARIQYQNLRSELASVNRTFYFLQNGGAKIEGPKGVLNRERLFTQARAAQNKVLAEHFYVNPFLNSDNYFKPNAVRSSVYYDPILRTRFNTSRHSGYSQMKSLLWYEQSIRPRDDSVAKSFQEVLQQKYIDSEVVLEVAEKPAKSWFNFGRKSGTSEKATIAEKAGSSSSAPIATHQQVSKTPTNTPVKTTEQKHFKITAESTIEKEGFYAYSEDWGKPRPVTKLQEPGTGALWLETELNIDPHLGILEIPTKDSYAISTIEVRDARGKTLDFGKDFRIERSGDGLGTRIVFTDKKTSLVAFKAGFHPEPIESVGLPPLHPKQLEEPLWLLHEAGFAEIAQDLKAKIQTANRMKLPIEEKLLEETYHSKSYYSKIPEKKATQTQLGLARKNPFAKYSNFLDANGTLCAQCDGGNALYRDFLAETFKHEPDIHVRIQHGYQVHKGEGYLTDNALHARTESRKGGRRAAISDATPRVMHPDNPRAMPLPPVETQAQPIKPERIKNTNTYRKRDELAQARQTLLEAVDEYEHFKYGAKKLIRIQSRNDLLLQKALQMNTEVEKFISRQSTFDEFVEVLHSMMKNNPKPQGVAEALSLVAKFSQEQRTALTKHLAQEELISKARPNMVRPISRYLDPTTRTSLERVYSLLEEIGKAPVSDLLQYWTFIDEAIGPGCALQTIVKRASARRRTH